jgi:hypothetical protein
MTTNERNDGETNERVEVWIALAQHFLDSETRQDIPACAWRCLQSGLTVEQARNVWRYEVTPAVFPNIWSMAGEWGCWNRQWLVARIKAARTKPGLLSYLLYRCQVHLVHRVWLAIERCMNVLLAAPPEGRETMAHDLSLLAGHYFDDWPRELAADAATLQRLATLRETALSVFELAAFGDEHGPRRARIDGALGAVRRQAVSEEGASV